MRCSPPISLRNTDVRESPLESSERILRKIAEPSKFACSCGIVRSGTTAFSASPRRAIERSYNTYPSDGFRGSMDQNSQTKEQVQSGESDEIKSVGEQRAIVMTTYQG